MLLSYSWNTHIIKLTAKVNFDILKAHKNIVKIFFYNFFVYIKMLNNYYKKHKGKPQK